MNKDLNLKNSEDALFDEWKKHREALVPDGVISEYDYACSPVRICYILKETNKTDPGFDLRTFIAKGGRKRTWENISRWTLGIHCLDRHIPWSDLSRWSETNRREQLKKIAAINLKKQTGTHTANYKEVETAALADKEFIKRQFTLYNPDITVCCGTGWIFRSALNHETIDIKTTNNGIKWYERSGGKYVVLYSHPEARVDDPILHYPLIDAIREISLNQ